MLLSHILATVAFYVSLSAAWPWPANLFIRDESGQLARRQNNNNNQPSPSSSAAPASSAQSNTASQTGSGSASATASGPATGSGSSAAPSSKPTGKQDGNQDNNSTSAEASSSVSITQVAAGGISMVVPAATTTTYYKVGQNITWVWNYTSLAVTPSAVNVLVECQSLGATYTVATNMSVDATASVVWDTSKESNANPPPDTDKYTLVVYDAGNPAGPTQTVAPGKLGSWDQFVFAMYTPQSYTALGEGYQCVTCNGALSNAERQTLGFLFTMVTITVLSFGWFTNGFMGL